MKSLVTLALSLVLCAVALGAQSPVAVPASKINWGPNPPSLPAGAEMAVLSGDPGKAGPYTLIGRFPDGYVFPTHSHPQVENVFVVSGTILVGSSATDSSLTILPAGSYTLMPKDMPHFARAKGPTTLLVYGMGPFDVAYAKPSDDPRRKSQ